MRKKKNKNIGFIIMKILITISMLSFVSVVFYILFTTKENYNVAIMENLVMCGSISFIFTFFVSVFSIK